MRQTLCICVALLVFCLAPAAAAECPIPDKPDDRCLVKLTQGGVTTGGVILPPGYYLTPETLERLDTEVRDLQEARTRLQAERDEYRKKARPTWWWVVTAAGTVGVAVLGTWAWDRR